MLKYQKWVVALVVLFALWLALCKYVAALVPDARVLQVVQMLPMYALVSFGAYSLAVIGINVISIEDCVDASKELDVQVKDAKEDLRKKGMKLVGEAADHRLDSVSLSSYLVDASRSKGADDGGLSVKRPNINQESAQVRRMVNSMDRIKELAADMGLTKGVLEMALDIYAEAERKEISMRGPEKDSVPVAILFIACRKNGHSRSLKEFEAASGVAKKRIGKTFLSLTRSMEIDMCQASTEEYVARFCSKLGLPHKTQHIANDVAKKADTLGLSTGKSPIAMAASVIYLVAAYTNAKRSIQEISNVTMIGEKNMKVVCKELNKSRVVLFEGVLLT
ncbi:TPA: hypothetical protein N0F65_010127 [Lagenidium giganteum]|uniref:Transcription factor TFIIB cyclin-like domain-containing protein n=1 Tax=Lagenidium giganteum TaxID=4803 RepID=A0AAV2Z4W2_9STRA|nr:TPA: hypothetical protein N0F65_010127 [Lagenidium giganteum]